MPQLDPTWFASQLFWLAITFIGLYFVLSRRVLPPIQDVLARRLQTRSGDIERAQSLKSEAEQARLDYERTLAEARDRAQSVMNDAIQAHKAQAEQAGKKLDGEIAAKLADAARSIAVRKQELKQALSESSGELAQMVVKKLMQRDVGREQIASAVARQKAGGR